MPKSNVQNRAFKDVFKNPVRFKIPFFQRGYAWERKQWDRLFLDIKEQVLDEVRSGTALSDVEHFFGPVVVMEEPGHPDVKEFLVIDGQQRITTIYLLLGIIRHQLLTKRHDSQLALEYAHQLDKYLGNDNDSSTDDYLKLKVFSSKGDRLSTYWTIFGSDKNPTTPLLSRDLQAYVPANSRVDDFKKYASKRIKADYQSIAALQEFAQALLQCLTIVWIPLEQKKDDPQAIFESLNDTGMPLKASELLCNYLFRPIIDAEGDPEELHDKLWLSSIRALGTDDVFEEYLRHLFSINETKMVGKHRKVYIHFKMKHRDLTSVGAKHQLEQIHSGTAQYKTIVDPVSNPHSDAEITRLLRAISATRMDSSTPFVLAVLRANAAGSLTNTQARAILRETLVLLVRRKMTELSTTSYDVMFPQLLGKVIHEPNQIEAFQDQVRRYEVWTSDQDFKHALENRPAYRSRDIAFTRLLLIEVDRSLQSHGQYPDYSTLETVEHVLPQTLDAAWKKYLGPDAENEQLGTLVNTIGNLCLLSGPANSSVGQNPFTDKQDAYSEVTALAREIKHFEGHWDIKAIRERSSRLAERANAIWHWRL